MKNQQKYKELYCIFGNTLKSVNQLTPPKAHTQLIRYQEQKTTEKLSAAKRRREGLS
jgi:hypothetical protein